MQLFIVTIIAVITIVTSLTMINANPILNCFNPEPTVKNPDKWIFAYKNFDD
jgi:hypothetical protein